MAKQLLYKDMARYYDLIYSFKDYKKEAETVRGIIEKYKKSKGKGLLEVACGTGKHLAHFKRWYNCAGIDLNEGMLRIARKRVNGVRFKKGNMIDFDLRKQYDALTCLFSSIGYVKTYKNLQKTINNFSRHLKTGGVVVIEPWFTKDVYRAGSPHMTVYEDDDIKIARLAVSKVKGSLSYTDMNYLIAERNKETRHFVDRHELGLFDTDKFLGYMNEAGLKARFLKRGSAHGRGMYVGVKK